MIIIECYNRMRNLHKLIMIVFCFRLSLKPLTLPLSIVTHFYSLGDNNATLKTCINIMGCIRKGTAKTQATLAGECSQ